jgi:hypothetical protein
LKRKQKHELSELRKKCCSSALDVHFWLLTYILPIYLKVNGGRLAFGGKGGLRGLPGKDGSRGLLGEKGDRGDLGPRGLQVLLRCSWIFSEKITTGNLVEPVTFSSLI